MPVARNGAHCGGRGAALQYLRSVFLALDPTFDLSHRESVAGVFVHLFKVGAARARRGLRHAMALTVPPRPACAAAGVRPCAQPLDSIPNTLLSVYSQTLDRRRAAAAAANDVVSPLNTAHSSGVLTLSPKTPSVLDPYDLIYLLKWCVPTRVTSADGRRHRSPKRARLGVGSTWLTACTRRRATFTRRTTSRRTTRRSPTASPCRSTTFSPTSCRSTAAASSAATASPRWCGHAHNAARPRTLGT